MKPARYLDVQAAADHLLFKSARHFHDFLYRRRKAGFPVRCLHRGRTLLFTEADLDAALSVEESRSLRAVKKAG